MIEEDLPTGQALNEPAKEASIDGGSRRNNLIEGEAGGGEKANSISPTMTCPSRRAVEDNGMQEPLIVFHNGQQTTEVRCGISNAKLSIEAPASVKIDIDASVSIFLTHPQQQDSAKLTTSYQPNELNNVS